MCSISFFLLLLSSLSFSLLSPYTSSLFSCSVSLSFNRDDDMLSIASMMSVSNLSTIGFLEDDEDDDFSYMYVCVMCPVIWLNEEV